MRCRFAASAIRNRAVTGNIARRILIAPPTGCAHLMAQEGGHRDEECCAHQKWWRKHGQIPQHRAHPLRLMRPLVVSVLLALRVCWNLALVSAPGVGRRDGPARRARSGPRYGAGTAAPSWHSGRPRPGRFGRPRAGRPAGRAMWPAAACDWAEIAAARPNLAAAVGAAWQYRIGRAARP